jgi:putative drug exporter of the RND superfamily
MSTDRRTKRPVSDSGFARTLRRMRWLVMLGWLIGVVFLFPIANALSNVTDNSNAANLPASAPSTRVIDLLLQQSAKEGPGQPQTDTAFVVFARDKGLTAADVSAISSARTAVGRLTGQPRGLQPPSSVQRSADGQAAYFYAEVTAPASSQGDADTAAVRAIRAAVASPAAQPGDGLQVAVTGPAAVTADTGKPSTTDLELTAVVIVALVFFVVYRSVLLWFFPLLGAVAAIVVAQASAHGLASAGLTVSSLSSSILIVLVFGAASDYALLLVHRYREELGRHDLAEDAMAAALRRTMPTLLASSATVTVAMICLLAARSASLHGLGPVGALGIVSALLAQTTFLPALLLVLGRAAFWPRVPRAGQAGSGESRLWAGIGTRVARHPLRVSAAAVILLGAACAGLAALHIDNSGTGQVKGHPGSVGGTQLVAKHFPAGLMDPAMILVPPAQAKAAVAAARATPNVAEVTTQGPVEGYDSYLVITSVSPYGTAGHAVIAGLRQRLSQDAPGALVGGDPAVQYDIIQSSGRDAVVLIPLILAVILVIIMLLLRAVVAPVVLVLTTALSFGASFGLSDLLWHYGLGYSGIESQVPVYIFVFLVALGVDYNIFLAARIREESRQLGTRLGTLRGLSVTGGVITAAGIVLAATFAALIPEPTVYLTEVGSAVAIGVLLDTLLVRTVLVPAALLTLAERAWWPARPVRTAGVQLDQATTVSHSRST